MSAFFAPEYFVSDFLNMGGYGSFIWPCYILAVLLVIGLYWHSQKKLALSEKD